MNELTVHGNIGTEPELHNGERGVALTFRLAVSDGYFDRSKGKWVARPTVWHNVVVFDRDLATNAHSSLPKGAAVVVTGQLTDNSYEGPDGSTIYRLQLVASEVAPSLRRATAVITKVAREDAAVPAGS